MRPPVRLCAVLPALGGLPDKEYTDKLTKKRIAR